MIVVQKLVTRWTKRSRGAPEAGVRSAVPMSYELALPTSPPAGALLLHLVEHVELHAFAPVAKVLVIPLAALADHVDELRLTARGADELVARYIWTGACGAPERPTGRAVALRPSSWSRVLHNGRTSVKRTWVYQSTVLNIGFGELAADTFQATAPIDVVDVRASLR